MNLICAASFIAAVGNADQFLTSRKLVAYLGLDPRVKQSGEEPARSGRISKRGSPFARWALVEAAWTAVLQPGPAARLLRADQDPPGPRQSDRRDRPQALGAVLVHAHPLRGLRPPAALADPQKLRQLEIAAGAPKYTRRAAGVWATNDHDAPPPSSSSRAKPRPHTSGWSKTS